jgi:hypothetical protein
MWYNRLSKGSRRRYRLQSVVKSVAYSFTTWMWRIIRLISRGFHTSRPPNLHWFSYTELFLFWCWFFEKFRVIINNVKMYISILFTQLFKSSFYEGRNTSFESIRKQKYFLPQNQRIHNKIPKITRKCLKNSGNFLLSILTLPYHRHVDVLRCIPHFTIPYYSCVQRSHPFRLCYMSEMSLRRSINIC